MILAAWTLALIACGDLIRERFQRRRFWLSALVLTAGAVFSGAWIWTTLPGLWCATILGPVILWNVTIGTAPSERPSERRLVINRSVAGVIVLWIGIVSIAPSTSGLGASWLHTSALIAGRHRLPTITAFMAVSLLLFLSRSSNLIVRTFLHSLGEFEPQVETADKTKVLRLTSAKGKIYFQIAESLQPQDTTNGDVKGADATEGTDSGGAREDRDSSAGLKGGRYIGPLERIALTALLLIPAFPVAAALMAAKGIVRFPEIAADGASGSRAEAFLVGSLVSWAIAGGAAGLLTYSL